MVLEKTRAEFEQASFFFGKYQESIDRKEKLYFLNASIVFTKAIFDVFRNEVANSTKNSNELKESINEIISYVEGNEYLEHLRALRNLELKEKILSYPMGWITTVDAQIIKEGKRIRYGEFVPGNKIKLYIANPAGTDNKEEEYSVEPFMVYQEIEVIDRDKKYKKTVEVQTTINESLIVWERVLAQLSSL